MEKKERKQISGKKKRMKGESSLLYNYTRMNTVRCVIEKFMKSRKF